MVKLVKLITGEEVIAAVKEDSQSVTLDNPVKMAVSREGVGMVPWLPFAKEKEPVSLRQECVMFMVDPDPDIVNAYNSQFGTGILVADSSILTK